MRYVAGVHSREDMRSGSEAGFGSEWAACAISECQGAEAYCSVEEGDGAGDGGAIGCGDLGEAINRFAVDD
jgi:hypothetical protein